MSETTKWPAGPWEVVGGEFPQQEDMTGEVVAYLIKLPGGPVISRGIADLIEAAPGMYAALQAAESALAVKASLRDPEQRRVEEALRETRAAMAAARGEAT